MNTRNLFNRSVYLIMVASFLGLVACDSPVSSSEDSGEKLIQSESAAYSNAKEGKGKKIDGQYIVVFKNSVDDAGKSAEQLAKKAGGKIKHIYGNSIKGFTITFPEQASPRALEALQNNPNVEFIEQDSEVFGSETQANATWGLDRSDQRALPMDGTYNYTVSGENVTVYIADSGINYTHVDFGGRASFGFDAFGEDGNDCYGHGTHVAGTVGGTQWGIAKNVDLVSVRVLDCNNSGTYSGVIAGVDWITANASGVSIVNMSLGGGGSLALDSAVENSIASGITYVVSAGNSTADACNFSPARTPSAITVGATQSDDSRADYSNYGSCIDVFAPGSEITSAYIGSNTATTQMWGTSMATPHVTGTVALYLQNSPDATPGEVESFIISNATQNIVTNSNSQNNHLLYSVFDTGSGTENAAPSADFTISTDFLNAQFTDGSTDSDGSISSWAWNFGDGTNSTAQNPSHTYSNAGTYTVTLTVTDDSGASDTVSKNITVEEEAVNVTPDANFSFSTDDLSVQFSDLSSDSDGSIVNWSWNFGNGSSSSSQNPSHTYTQAGSYTVTLTVTDNNGASDSVSKTVSVTASVAGIDLNANGYKNKGRWTTDLSWSGATSSKVDIFRNGSKIKTVNNSGSYTDGTSNRGSGSLTYKVCETGTFTCSDSVTVNF